MTKLYVSEYSSLTKNNDIPVPMEPINADQVVDYNAGAAASAAFKANTRFVQIQPDSICSIAFGTAPTATTSNKRMAAGETRIYEVPQGASYKISAITNT